MDEDLLLLCVLLLAKEVKGLRRRITGSSDEDVSSDDATSENNSNIAGNPEQHTSSPKASRSNTVANMSKRSTTCKAPIAHTTRRSPMKRHIFSSNKGSFKKIKTTTLSSSDSENAYLSDESDNVQSELLSDNHSCEPCKVAIAHQNFPEDKLNDEEIMRIKNSLLTEIDKTADLPDGIGFISSISEDGWLSLTCQNTQTKNWLMGIIEKLNSTLNMNLKASIGGLCSNNFICTLLITPDDIMAPDALKHRLAKQNLGLSTNEWRLLSTVKNERGGQTVSFYIDSKSKSIIESRGSKLFLNFSQTTVEVT